MPGENLTRAEAELRADTVTPSTYTVALDLRGEDTFISRTRIEFEASGPETFVDLIAPEVRSITLNGEDVPASAFANSRITLSGLKKNNVLEVDAVCAFMNTGEGMHKFVDPVDGETYLYTQFEVADARRVFPVFEQPDLKATFTFEITAPEHWKVFSNSPTPTPVADGEGSATWSFSPTEKMSSYLTAIAAGPYAGGEGEVESASGQTIPLGVYCRASLAEHLDVEEVLDITKAGFGFYENEYGIPYPFRKYDQVFVPEFNAGAMENIGLVTITEAYVFRSRASGAIIERRAITILHELAHMWFGDLVTMKWWNDLWLNESFAEFMSHLAADEATRWDQGWQTFLASEKTWAMTEDQLVSTHPVVSTVSDLGDVWSNFDGITYGKGASVLKQLVAYVGRTEFMAGLKEYFTKHAWGNTELSDLLVELEKSSGRDLSEWSKVWLEESGVTVAAPDFDIEDGVYTRFAVRQELGNATSLRPSRIAIGRYDLDGDKLVGREPVYLDIDGESTEASEIVGEKAADLVLVNDEDLGYMKIRLDDDSLATAIKHINGFENKLARTLVLTSAWDMCRDAKLSAHAFAELVLSALPTEDHPTVARILLKQLETAVGVYSDPARREEFATEVADRLFAVADEAEPGSDLQFQTALAACTLATSEEQLDRLEAWREGKDLPEGFTLDTDARWNVIWGLAAADRITQEDIESELASDNTATGREAAWRARASLKDGKERAFTAMVEEASLPNLQQRAALIGFRAGDPADVAPFFKRYLASLTTVWTQQTYEMAQQLATGMFTPSLIGRTDLVDVEPALEKWLEDNPEAATSLRRTVSEHLDNTRRALAAQSIDVG